MPPTTPGSDGAGASYKSAGVDIEAGERAWVFAPRGVPHTFKVGPKGARALTFSFPSRFGDFVAEMGEPAPELEVPPHAPVDERRLAEVAHRYGIEIVGPPPD